MYSVFLISCYIPCKPFLLLFRGSTSEWLQKRNSFDKKPAYVQKEEMSVFKRRYFHSVQAILRRGNCLLSLTLIMTRPNMERAKTNVNYRLLLLPRLFLAQGLQAKAKLLPWLQRRNYRFSNFHLVFNITNTITYFPKIQK